ncbi:hypothetical protein L228DRAFT_267099 [Xylona heveae TC161]|uniref:Uncharacterized protein n=1 Tax=Xylona heveae (strain CBS 132557 / TC161) TaxID=1328760 RepID=A0A165IET9_XYLHT|nr:hypothetical protein L228DRAFT_267099 [Xylona heveae TC161]KZF24793.1 hypothetical protein L228DRAFT_267099 [Xylona heveae TC161]
MDAPLPARFEPDAASVGCDDNGTTPPPLDPFTALARYEIEAGRGNEGTKVLMVEWEDVRKGGEPRRDWHVSWPGKRTVLPAEEQSDSTYRLYFLIPPGDPIPPTVTVSHVSSSNTESKDNDTSGADQDTIRINPLPAIFPPQLGLSVQTSGRKGVYHTIWAKKRLSVLQREIDHEMQANIEGVALEMAMQEKDWIEKTFGISSRPLSIAIPNPGLGNRPLTPLSPGSPRSPGGSRLSEMLRGLKIGTTEEELSTRRQANHGSSSLKLETPLEADAHDDPSNESHPFSPEAADVAISSFSTFHGTDAPRPQTHNNGPLKRFVAQSPPLSVQQQQRQNNGLASLDAAILPSEPFLPPPPPPPPSAALGGMNRLQEEEDDLFAKPLSPRSPDMPKSPFSFATADTFAYIKGAKS